MDNLPSDHRIDRSGWPHGPWDGEPDRIEWRLANGYPALIVRNRHGALCGYVGVPKGHPAYGINYDDPPVSHIVVHGGATYTDKCFGAICHVPAPGEPDDVWWIGFDCHHGGDQAPGMLAHEIRMRAMLPNRGYHDLYEQLHAKDVYRDVAYVREQVELLGTQLDIIGQGIPLPNPWDDEN